MSVTLVRNVSDFGFTSVSFQRTHETEAAAEEAVNISEGIHKQWVDVNYGDVIV